MFDIRDMPAPTDRDLLELASRAEPATIGHFRFRGFPDGGIVGLANVATPSVAGTAVTLALPGNDSTLFHHAVGLLRPGDFLLIDRLGDRRHACLGGGVAAALARTGIAGLVVDGPCADPAELRDSGVPVWGRGFSAITTRLYGIGGAMNVPVSIGGAVANPGDVVVADESGIVLLPVDEAVADIRRAIEMQRNERRALKELDGNRTLGDLFGASRLIRAKTG